MKAWRVTIMLTDDTTEILNWVTEIRVTDACLHLHSKDGEYAPRVHLGSWPLAHIRNWRQEER